MSIPPSSFRQFLLDNEWIRDALFQSTVEARVLVSDNGQILYINQQSYELFGYEAEELYLQPIEKLIPARFQQSHQQLVQSYMQHPRPREIDHGLGIVGKHKDGQEFSLEVRLSPFEYEKVSYVMAHLFDISYQLQIEKDLRESQQRLTSIIETAVDGILTISELGIIETVNPAAARLFGYQAEEIIGKNISTLMPEPDKSQHDQYLERYRGGGEAKIIGIGREVKGRKKDGAVFPFYLSVSEVKLEDGRIFTGIVHDLTEQKAAEDALRNYSEELEKRVEARTKALAHAIDGLENEIRERKEVEAALLRSQEELQEALDKEKELNELKSRFVSMASHEFRTPLSTILSSVSLLGRYQLEEHKEKREKHIQRIKSNVRTLTQILNDFLSLSKLEEGKINLQPELIDLSAFLAELVEEIQEQSKEGQKIQLEYTDFEKEVEIDPQLCKNILYNLLSNAIKYSEAGTRVFLRCKQDESGLHLEVQDQGIGIPHEEQIYLFERFFRARNATHIQGTGLGLSIVKRYVDLMGGSISFQSKGGTGTTFFLYIPFPDTNSASLLPKSD